MAGVDILMAPRGNKKKVPFTMVRRSIWGSARFRSLPGSDAKLLYFYYLTCPHQTGTGCFLHNEAYALADLKQAGIDWTQEHYQDQRAEVVASGLVLADPETGEILIDRWWDANAPNNQKWLEGARVQCEAIESPVLRQAAHTALDGAWAAFRESKGLPAVPPQNAPVGVPATPGGMNRDEARAFLNSMNGGRAA